MLNPTVTRRWTIGSWLVAGTHDQRGEVAVALSDLGADAILLQAVRRDDASVLAAALGWTVEWALSHYPGTPFQRDAALGLATLTPHTIGATAHRVVSEKRSVWSKARRITQVTLVGRPDHSAYSLFHAAPPIGDVVPDQGPAPTVVVRPGRVASDPANAVELPDGATLVDHRSSKPISRVAPLLVATFEMDWVQGDFPS